MRSTFVNCANCVARAYRRKIGRSKDRRTAEAEKQEGRKSEGNEAAREKGMEAARGQQNGRWKEGLKARRRLQSRSQQ